MPAPERNEEFWREYLTHPDSLMATGRRFFSRMPADPRCRLCSAPFAGGGGFAMRLIGKRQSTGNPNYCNSCEKVLLKHHGGGPIANYASGCYHAGVNSARLVRTARRRAGMTQRELAVASGIPQPSIARIERGLSVPRVDTMQRLLRAAGQDLEAYPQLGVGVDRTQIRALLAMTPEGRGRAAQVAGRNLLRLISEARIVDRSTPH